MGNQKLIPGRSGQTRILPTPAQVNTGLLPVDTGRTPSSQHRLDIDIGRNLLIHRAGDIPVDQFNQITNPVLTTTGVTVDVLAFQVPVGFVLEVQAIALTYHDPVIHQGDWVSWRLAVNNSRQPFIGAQGAEFNPGGFGEVDRPVNIGPILIQPQSTVQLQIVTFDAAFAAAPVYLVVSGRLQGVLHPVTAGQEVNL
jgi:hypothetical protein